MKIYDSSIVVRQEYEQNNSAINSIYVNCAVGV